MSSLRKRSEHIERIRYPNPLPLPPYPPKLLAIPTPVSRFVNPQAFGGRLAQAHPLPVVVDAEAGMPLNLTDFPQAWYTDQELEADDDVFPRLDINEVDVDPEDAFLLSDVLEKLPSASNGSGTDKASNGVIDSSHITWLRRTEYLAAEQQKRKRNELASRGGDSIDASKEAQLQRIKKSFEVANEPLAGVRHPTRPNLRAVESFSLLPDPDTWSSRFDVFRFGDLPGRTQDGKALHDPRLQTGILRPHLDAAGMPLYSLYLVDAPADEEDDDADKEPDEDMFGDDDEDEEDAPKAKKRKAKLDDRTPDQVLKEEDANAARLVQSRVEGMPIDGKMESVENDPFNTEQSENAPAHFRHVRDYEAHDETERKDQELIFTFVDSLPNSSQEPVEQAGTLPPITQLERSYRLGAEKSARGVGGGEGTKTVYYHPVSMRASLRVRRRRPEDEQPPQHWDGIVLQKRSFSTFEKVESLHARCSVDDMDLARIPERIELPEEEEEEVQQEEEDAARGHGQDSGDGDGNDAPDASAEQSLTKEADARTKENVDAEEEEEDDEEGEKEGRDASGSEDDDAEQSDEEMDEDELAALQADAGDDAADDTAGDGESRRRSRRSAAGANDEAANAASSRPRELLSMDEED